MCFIDFYILYIYFILLHEIDTRGPEVSRRDGCTCRPLSTLHLRRAREYPGRLIGNMDETPVLLEMPGVSTLAHVGESSISVTSTGQEAYHSYAGCDG